MDHPPCHSCLHWRNHNGGQCRKHAPAPSLTSDYQDSYRQSFVQWPSMPGHDLGCGDHQPLPVTQSREVVSPP